MFKSYNKLTESQLNEIKKILLIQQKPFGDVLLNTGYFPALRKKFPDAQIDYLVQRPYLTVVEDNPHLDNIVVMEKKSGWRYYIEQLKTIPKIRKRKYDLIIDQIRGTSSARLVMFCGAKYKLGYLRKRWNFVYNVKVPKGEKRYYSKMKFDLLAALDIKEVEHNLEYIIRKESYGYIENWLKEANLENKKIITFSPGTPGKRKQWDLNYYAQLGDLIHENTDFNVVILWGPGEKKDAESVKELMKTDAMMVPPTTFNQAGALLNYTNMLVGNDSGINHLAVSQKTPSIAIFGPTSNPVIWAAWHKDIHFYFRDWNFTKSGDYTFNISPAQVFAKIEEFFNKE